MFQSAGGLLKSHDDGGSGLLSLLVGLPCFSRRVDLDSSMKSGEGRGAGEGPKAGAITEARTDFI